MSIRRGDVEQAVAMNLRLGRTSRAISRQGDGKASRLDEVICGDNAHRETSRGHQHLEFGTRKKIQQRRPKGGSIIGKKLGEFRFSEAK